jgi:peptidoglycan/LPS O-acetylase OafA/YrhL
MEARSFSVRACAAPLAGLTTGLRRFLRRGSVSANVSGRGLGNSRDITRHRATNFDFLRLLAATFVVYGHSYPLTGRVSPSFCGNGFGSLGVKIFFSISGYMIASSWLHDPHFGRFWLRRALRILPALTVVVLLSVVVLGPLLTNLPLSIYLYSPQTFYYFYNLVLYINYDLPGVFDQNIFPHAVNGNLWSLPAEVFMYATVPAILCGASVFRKAACVLAAGASILITILLLYCFPRKGQLIV